MGISRLLGASALGKYFVASKVAFLPSEAAVAVIAAVAFPLYASHREDVHRSAQAFSALFTGQVVILFPIFAIIIALAPVLETALGARWADTAPTVQILAAACMVGLFGDSITPLLRGQGRADRAFFIEVAQTGVRLALLWPLIWQTNVTVIPNPDRLRRGQVLKLKTHPSVQEIADAVDTARGNRRKKPPTGTTTRIGEIREAQE